MFNWKHSLDLRKQVKIVPFQLVVKFFFVCERKREREKEKEREREKISKERTVLVLPN